MIIVNFCILLFVKGAHRFVFGINLEDEGRGNC